MWCFERKNMTSENFTKLFMNNDGAMKNDQRSLAKK